MPLCLTSWRRRAVVAAVHAANAQLVQGEFAAVDRVVSEEGGSQSLYQCSGAGVKTFASASKPSRSAASSWSPSQINRPRRRRAHTYHCRWRDQQHGVAAHGSRTASSVQ